MASVADEVRVRAEAKYVRTSARKARLVVDEIRGLTVPQARTMLAFMPQAAARDVAQVLASAAANAEANHGLAGDDLLVAAAYVGEGPTLKRWKPRARGRVGRIKKRTCHITIQLGPPSEGLPVPVPEEAPKPAPTRRRAKPAGEAAPTEEKPKRTRKKAVEEPAAEAAAPATQPEAGEAQATAEPAEAKPKRTRSRKPAAVEPAVDEELAGADEPAAPADVAEGAAEQPAGETSESPESPADAEESDR
jgi:large subunit ribosomal protein L22